LELNRDKPENEQIELDADNFFGVTAILYAISSRNLQVVKMLLDQGASMFTTVFNLDSVDKDSETFSYIPRYSILYHSIIKKADHITKYLLSKYRDTLPVNAQALAFAIIANPDIAEFFLDNYCRNNRGGLVTYNFTIFDLEQTERMWANQAINSEEIRHTIQSHDMRLLRTLNPSPTSSSRHSSKKIPLSSASLFTQKSQELEEPGEIDPLLVKIKYKPFLKPDLIELMIKYKRSGLIQHPVVSSYLKEKWKRAWFPFAFEFYLYIIFLGILTGFALESDVGATAPLLCMVSFLSLTTEIYRIYAYSWFYDASDRNQPLEDWVNWRKQDYGPQKTDEESNFEKNLEKFKDMIFNDFGILELILYCCAFVVSIAYFADSLGNWRRTLLSFVVTFAWINLPLYLRRISFSSGFDLGLFADMLISTIALFAKFFLTFSAILLAFTLGFFILLQTPTDRFGNQALVTLNMLYGDLGGFFYDKVDGQGAGIGFLYVTYLIFVPLLLTNLLIGLTVGETQGLRNQVRNTRALWLAARVRQIDQHFLQKTYMRFLAGRPIQNRDLTMHQDAIEFYEIEKDRSLPEAISKRFVENSDNHSLQNQKVFETIQAELNHLKENVQKMRQNFREAHHDQK